MSVKANEALRVAVVGPCSAGKSTLIPVLAAAGYEARQPAQEHSFVPDMWQRITKPDILIYLDVSYQAARRRRPYIDGGHQRLADQHARLAHARLHCDFYMDTSDLSPAEVSLAVLNYVQEWQEQHQRR